MALIKRWSTYEDWTGWLNADLAGKTRLNLDGLALPTSMISHLGSGIPETENVARYRFAQFFMNPEGIPATTDQTGNGHDLSFPPSGTARIDNDGLWSPIRNSYVYCPSTGMSFDYPNASSNFYVSLWFNSILEDYSAGRGYLVIYHNTVAQGQVAYGIFIDTDNIIKGELCLNGTTSIVISSGHEVIKDQWQHVYLVAGSTATPGIAAVVVDNDWPESFDTYTIQGIGPSNRFSIGSASQNSFYGFAGHLDELIVSQYSGSLESQTNHRFETQSFISTVVDTEQPSSLLLGVLVEVLNHGNSGVEFAFKASDNLSGDPLSPTGDWTAFTAVGQIESGKAISANEFGLFVKGRYQQVKARLRPSDDAWGTLSPTLQSLQITTGSPGTPLATANYAFEPGVVLGQIVRFPGTKRVSKSSLDLTVRSDLRREYFTSRAGTVTFPAANFQDSRDDYVWQPVNHTGGWATSGISISPSHYSGSYTDAISAVASAPYLKYLFYLDQPGIYDVWCYAKVTGDTPVFWALNDDQTDLRALSAPGLPSAPYWQKIGTMSSPEGGNHSLTIYLGNPTDCILDEWCLTVNRGLVEDGAELSKPWPVSQGPYMTALRIASLVDGGINGWDAETSTTMWLSSLSIADSGRYNYGAVQPGDDPLEFVRGLSLEYWQIGGDFENFAAWYYTFVNEGYLATRSTDYGVTFE